MATYSYNDLLEKGSSEKLLWVELSEQEKNITLIKFEKPVLGKITGLDGDKNIIFDTGYKVIPQDHKVYLEGNGYNSLIGKKDDKMFATTTTGGGRRRKRRTRKTIKSKRKMYSRRR